MGPSPNAALPQKSYINSIEGGKTCWRCLMCSLCISAVLCDSAVYRLYGFHYRRGAENRRDTQRKLLRQSRMTSTINCHCRPSSKAMMFFLSRK
jgi:hypothetical protein